MAAVKALPTVIRLRLQRDIETSRCPAQAMGWLSESLYANDSVVAAQRFISAGHAIVDNGIAASTAARRPDVSSAAKPIAGIKTARKDDWTIEIVSDGTGNSGAIERKA